MHRQIGAVAEQCKPFISARQAMTRIAALTFKSITLTEQRLRGEPDDHALSTVRLDLEHADGHLDHDVPIVVWHALGRFGGGIVRLIVQRAAQDVAQDRAVARCIEDYYRRHVVVEQQRIRFAEPNSAAPITGVRLSAPERVTLPGERMAVA